MERDAFDLELAAASEQGSNNWFTVRAGRFTSSELFKLMDAGKRPMTAEELKARPKTGKGSATKTIHDPAILDQKTLTYIRNKVAEQLTGMPSEMVNSTATRWGDTWEPYAAEYFTQRTGLEFEILSFVPFGDYAGGSPDRKIKDKPELLEIKCPYNSGNQIDYLMLTDQWDLKSLYPEYYWQAQGNLLFNSASLLHFVTFDPRMKEEKDKMFYLPIKPIEEDQDLIILKLKMATEELLRTLKILRTQKDSLNQLIKFK